MIWLFCILCLSGKYFFLPGYFIKKLTFLIISLLNDCLGLIDMSSVAKKSFIMAEQCNHRIKLYAPQSTHFNP